jgi:hypothetical protein
MMALFWEVVETLRGRVQLNEESSWGHISKGYMLPSIALIVSCCHEVKNFTFPPSLCSAQECRAKKPGVESSEPSGAKINLASF